jgi:hypothetical protein
VDHDFSWFDWALFARWGEFIIEGQATGSLKAVQGKATAPQLLL